VTVTGSFNDVSDPSDPLYYEVDLGDDLVPVRWSDEDYIDVLHLKKRNGKEVLLSEYQSTNADPRESSPGSRDSDDAVAVDSGFGTEILRRKSSYKKPKNRLVPEYIGKRSFE